MVFCYFFWFAMFSFEGLEVKTTYGESLTIFGEERFKILETIENCMKYNSSKINSILAEKDVMTSIMVFEILYLNNSYFV